MGHMYMMLYPHSLNCMHFSTCMNFLTHMDYIVHGNLTIFKSSNISKTKEAAPTKIGVHAFDINPHLHEFIEPILFDSIFWQPWTTAHGQKGKFGHF